MTITTTATHSTLEVKIQADNNTVITEDISSLHYRNGRYVIPEDAIKGFLNVAIEAMRFNGMNDVEIVLGLYNILLNKAEQKDFFLEIMNK